MTIVEEKVTEDLSAEEPAGLERRGAVVAAVMEKYLI